MRIHPRRIGGLVLTALCCAATVAHPAQEPDYEGYYAKGTTFAAFLEKTKSRREEWRAHYNDAAVTAEMMTRMRAIPERRRILVVAEDWCGDSVNTVPYLARLVDGAPERLEMRLIDSKAGRTIMEAYRTPDGRAATPTIVVLGPDGRVIGSLTERPAALRAWLDQQNAGAAGGSSAQGLHERTMKWYAEDAGQATVAEIAEILAR